MIVAGVLATLALAGGGEDVSPTPVAEHHAARHDGCRSARCDERVTRKLKRQTIRPYLAWLRSVRMCESGGNYAANTGNGFFGAYQFVLSTWRSAGGWGMPHLAEPLEQDYRAVVWRRMIGNPHSPAGWPVCG